MNVWFLVGRIIWEGLKGVVLERCVIGNGFGGFKKFILLLVNFFCRIL